MDSANSGHCMRTKASRRKPIIARAIATYARPHGAVALPMKTHASTFTKPNGAMHSPIEKRKRGTKENRRQQRRADVIRGRPSKVEPCPGRNVARAAGLASLAGAYPDMGKLGLSASLIGGFGPFCVVLGAFLRREKAFSARFRSLFCALLRMFCACFLLFCCSANL